MERIIKDFYLKIKKSIELNKYNDFSIAEYFKKQGAQIGENNRIEIRNLGTEPYLIKIGNHCTIAPGVYFGTHDGSPWLFTEEYPSLQKFDTIVIKDNCFIGQNAILLGGVNIGPNSIVGAGSVVTKDVPPNVVVAGNPARVICSIEEYKEKAIQAWNEQKPPRYFRDLEEEITYSPEYIQKIKYRDMDMLRKHLIKFFWNNRP